MNGEKFEQTLKIIRESVDNTGLRADDNHILDVAARVYISESIQNGQTTQKTTKTNSTQRKITDKQKKYLQNLGYSGSLDLTSKEAQQVIKELTQNKSGVKNEFKK